MHSSRMRTARALTVSHNMLAGRGGGLVPVGVSDHRGGLLPGGSAPGGCLLWGGVCFVAGGNNKLATASTTSTNLKKQVDVILDYDTPKTTWNFNVFSVNIFEVVHILF